MRRTLLLALLALPATACDSDSPASGGTSSGTGGTETEPGSSSASGEWAGDTVVVRIVAGSVDACESACGDSVCAGATRPSIDEGKQWACSATMASGTPFDCSCVDSTESTAMEPTHAVSPCLDSALYREPLANCDAWCEVEGLGECSWVYVGNGCNDIPAGGWDHLWPAAAGSTTPVGDTYRFACEL